jgi:hypothetical protein
MKSIFGNEVTLDSQVVEHVLKRHPEMNKLRNLIENISLTIASPDFVIQGRYGGSIAARRIEAGVFMGKWIMVPYEEGGSVKTAFIASKVEKMLKRGIVLWTRR